MTIKERLLKISYCSTSERRERICRILSENGIGYDIEQDDKAVNLIVGDPENSPVTICAHYDIVPGSCGANDNGSSCAVMLDLIEKHAKDPGVCYVFLDREESGFYGSSLHFSRYSPVLTINLDVTGGGENLVFHNSVTEDEEGSILNKYLDRRAERAGAIRTDMLPMCDTYNIMRYGHEVISFSAFPEKDAAIIRKTGYLSCMEVLKYMHCGCYDDIEYICTDTMEAVEKLLEDFLLAVQTIELINHRREKCCLKRRKKDGLG